MLNRLQLLFDYVIRVNTLNLYLQTRSFCITIDYFNKLYDNSNIL